MRQARSWVNQRSRHRFSRLPVRHGAPRWSAHQRTSGLGGVGALNPQQHGRIDPSRHSPPSCPRCREHRTQVSDPLVPTVSGTSNSGLGRGKLHVELLLRMRPCRRDRRGTRWQADPLKHMKIEPLLVGLEHLRSVKCACWSEKLQQARTGA